jgi:WD40 repeat protein
LYDVRRKSSKSIIECDLERFTENTDGEVTCAAFSPDGIYLAAARSDNRTDIYDARNIGRGVIHVFEHSGPSRGSPGSESYGVVEAVWVESPSRRLGLVTGGNDGELTGCSRLSRLTGGQRLYSAMGRS